MVNQVTEIQSSGKIIDFIKYKEKRPYFQKPIKIVVETPIFETYYMLKNVVYREKQILALKKDMHSHTIFLVEAKISDGQLIKLIKLPNDYLTKVSELISEELFLNQNLNAVLT